MKKGTEVGEGHVRWLIRRDMDEVLSIERRSFQMPWTEEDFMIALRQRNVIGCVIEVDRMVVGFVLYELHKIKFRILNLAVDPQYRRCGYGTAMLQRMIGKLSEQRRTELDLEVRESNLEGQLFLQRNGFRAVRVLKGRYEGVGLSEDAYLMRYRLKGGVRV